MTCRGCEGQDICNSTNICCVQYRIGCNTGCNSLPAGFARIGVDGQGNLQVCRFVGAQCQCSTIQAIGPSTLVDVPNTGNFTHTSGTGVVTTIDVCAKIGNCNLSALQDVTYAVGGPPSGTNNCLIFSPLTNLWQPAPCPGNDVSTLTDNAGTSTFTHVAGGVTTTIDICAKVALCTIGNLQNVAPGADTPNAGQALVWNQITGLWEPRGPDFLQDQVNTDTFTHTAVDGQTVIIGICGKIRFCPASQLADVNYPTPPTAGQILTWNAVSGNWEPTTPAAADVSTLTDVPNSPNITHVAGGVTTTIDVCAKIRANCTDTLVLDAATNTYIHTAVNGTVQNIPRCPGVGAIQNRLPTANDDGCNTSGVGVLCPGATFIYDPTIAGADTATNGNCRRQFVNRGTNACGGAVWEEVCVPPTGQGSQVGVNAAIAIPSNVITGLAFQNEVTADTDGAITYNAATGQFTINCPGMYEVQASVMGEFVQYNTIAGQANMEFVLNTLVNGAPSRRLAQEFFNAGDPTPTFPAVEGSGQFQLNVGDTFQLAFFHNRDQPLNINLLTDNDNFIRIRRVRC